ncbi:hypothetical protein UFOVP506_40 [uncultured Caudovirales phage]|uniref:Large polyvalent protein associated domain-containing protein n=1 Tax=uncultured Caudovirales phage TaxID=2100421 RepID=A0A6J5MM41_9CAUD|nr:hypothetical protein UFOVP506_40 [uncultured Caudovirales phage]
MAEAKPKGAPVFLEIPTTGKTITLPGVTSLSTDDELKAAADAWIAKNYKGPTLAAPVLARSPAAGGAQDVAPAEEINPPANRQAELKAYTPTTITGGVYDALQSGFATLADLIPGFDERRANDYASNILRNIKTGTEGILGIEKTERSAGDIATGRATLEDYFNVGLLALPFAAKPVAAGVRRVAPELSATLGRFATGPGAVADELAAAVPETALTPQMAAVANPTTPPPVVPSSIAKAVDLPEAPVTTAAIPEAAVAPRNAAYDLPASTPETGLPAIAAMEVKGQTQPIPTTEIGGKVANFAADYSNLAGLTRPADMPFSEFFYRHFKAGTLPEEEVSKLVTKYDLKPEDLNELIAGTRQGYGDAARVLQRLSVASRYVPREAADIAKKGLEQADDLSFWKRLPNAYRGALVSSVATTMRNVLSSVPRGVLIDPMTNLMDSAVNAAANPFRQQKVGVNAFDAAAVLTDRFAPGRNTKFWEQMKNVRPEINNELAATYAADVVRVTKKDAFSKVEKAIDVANLFNRVTETATRKAMFPVYLRREATRLNLDFDELVDTGGIARLPEEAWATALDDTLGFTYSAKSEVADKVGEVLDKMGKLGTTVRVVGSTVMPFPRFMMNAMKFQFDYSPAGFAKLLTAAERAKFAKGDVSAVSKAIVGSSMLYGAYQFRNSENAGEKWYEGRLPNGKTVDLRPYFPAAPYLLVADVIKRAQDNTLDQAFQTADILQGLSGAQFRAGTGLYVTDQLLKDLSGAAGNLDKAKTVVTSWLADVGAGFLQPFSTFKDFYAQYDPEEAVYRDTKDNPLAALVRPIPGAQQAMGVPAASSATREGPMTTDNPIFRQLLGATIRPPKNIVESELDKLGLTAYDVGSKTGEVAIDRLVNRDLGIIAEREIAPLLRSPQYQSLDNVGKSAAIKGIYATARGVANDKFNAENPELSLLKKFKGMNREEKIMLNRKFEANTGMKADELLRQLSKAPLMKSQEQFDALPVGAEYTDPGDYKVYTKGK